MVWIEAKSVFGKVVLDLAQAALSNILQPYTFLVAVDAVADLEKAGNSRCYFKYVGYCSPGERIEAFCSSQWDRGELKNLGIEKLKPIKTKSLNP